MTDKGSSLSVSGRRSSFLAGLECVQDAFLQNQANRGLFFLTSRFWGKSEPLLNSPPRGGGKGGKRNLLIANALSEVLSLQHKAKEIKTKGKPIKCRIPRKRSSSETMNHGRERRLLMWRLGLKPTLMRLFLRSQFAIKTHNGSSERGDNMVR